MATITAFFKAIPSQKKKNEPTNNSSAEQEDAALVQKRKRSEQASSALPSTLSPLLELEFRTMSPDWFQAFKPEMQKPYFLQIKQFLEKEKANECTVYPPEQDMYAFTRVPLSRIKVVIIGQDPYHGPGQAHGLCFSVQKGVPPPPSLKNIFRELESDLGPNGFKRPNHGNLSAWVNQGVLLLNAALTVRQNEPNSHAKTGWHKFTDAIVSHIIASSQSSGQPVVFMLWGMFAQKKIKALTPKSRTSSNSKTGSGKSMLVLMATHPSPLGANNGGWFGCKHFSKANAFLKSCGVKEIDWNSINNEISHDRDDEIVDDDQSHKKRKNGEEEAVQELDLAEIAKENQDATPEPTIVSKESVSETANQP